MFAGPDPGVEARERPFHFAIRWLESRKLEHCVILKHVSQKYLEQVGPMSWIKRQPQEIPPAKEIKKFGTINIPKWAEMFKQPSETRTPGYDRPNVPVVKAGAVVLSEAFVDMAEWQKKEPGYNEIIERLLSGDGRPAERIAAHWSQATQMVVKIWNKLTVADGMLCRRSKSGVNKCIVPEGWWVTIMKLYHDVPGASHEGATKMYERIKQKFYWYDMASMIKLYVHGCITCQTEKKFQIRKRTAGTNGSGIPGSALPPRLHGPAADNNAAR